MNMEPLWTIFNLEKVIDKKSEINNVVSPFSITRRLPRERLYQEDEYESFISQDSVKDCTCLNQSFFPSGKKQNIFHHVLFYKLEENELSITELTNCVRIDSELHAQFFSKGGLSHYSNGLAMEVQKCYLHLPFPLHSPLSLKVDLAALYQLPSLF